MKDKINFLHINASDIRWGASVAGYRLHRALLEKGYGSHILCGLKESQGVDTSSIMPGRFGYIPNALVGKFFNALGLQSFGYPSSFFIRFSKRVKNWADVAVLRDLHWWYFSIGVLPWLAQEIPLIWRLPDMWALTGHCIYSYDCQKWTTGCGGCPYLYEYPGLRFDTTHFLWLRKKEIYKKLLGRLVFISPSRWLKKIIGQSPLTRDFRCEYIPSAVDLKIFRPGLKESSRAILGIGTEEKVIMFSSFKLTDKRKGAKDIIEVINDLRNTLDFTVTVLIAGYRGEELPFAADMKIIKVNFTREDRFLACCYNASDAYLCLSKADNLPNTLVEASACGLPIVTLDKGGCGEALENGKSGYIVKDNKEAIDALRDILSDPTKQEEFSKNARRFAETNFSMDSQVSSYVKLSQELIKE
jgi:glycosyltransferase involved in cell wall biosynthesis